MTSSRPSSHHGFFFLWGWPMALGVLTAIGLVAALFSDDGWGDHLAAVCLAIPVLVALWFGWLRRPPARHAE